MSAAIAALLGQSFHDFELVISDNASTDRTREICEAFAAGDKRIRYFRQAQNVGAAANFDFVLRAARGEYFMWAGSDDSWHACFIESNFNALQENQCLVASISGCTFGGELHPPSHTGSSPLFGTFGQKIAAFSTSTHANARFYSLFRKSTLLQVERLTEFDYVAGDWAYILQIAKIGDFNLDEHLVGFFKGSQGSGSSKSRFRYPGKLPIEHLAPYFRFSRSLWQLSASEPLSTKFQAAWCIIRFNLAALREQYGFKHFRMK